MAVEGEPLNQEEKFLLDMAEFVDPTTVKVPTGLNVEPRKITKEMEDRFRLLLDYSWHPSQEDPEKDVWKLHSEAVHWLITTDNWDWWTLVDGPERVGKSTFFIKSCALRDPTFSDHWKERIYYFGSEALENWNRLPRGASSGLDEAAEGWYRKTWFSDVNISLDLATVQLGDRNLDIHILTPSLGLVGDQAVRRAKEWVNVMVRHFERGRVEVRIPHWTIYANKPRPFWGRRGGAPDLVHYFNPLDEEWAPKVGLPVDFYAQYAEFKLKAGILRVKNYVRNAKAAEAPKRSLGDQVEEALGKIGRAMKKDESFSDKLRNRVGSFDWRSVAVRFDYPQDVSKAIAGELNRTYGKRKLPISPSSSPQPSPTRRGQSSRSRGKLGRGRK